MVSQDEINSNFLDIIRWLKSEYGYTQAYIVEKAELAPNAISKIKNGKANAGDETITKLCNAFNLNSDYLYGRSSYKTKLEESEAKLDKNIHQEQSFTQPQSYIDPGSQINAIIAAKDETIDSLKSRIADLQHTIADKIEIIRARESRILDLERRLAQSNADDLTKYPFAIGAAEDHKQTKSL
jgi:transcriptional regulator with XRE-family HTH domain